ncbi:MAG: dihydroneopterin aldolase [Bacteroidota bacterium]
MAKIFVEGIKLYAYHGCMEEEGKIGRSFVVDVVIDTDLSKAALSDKLTDTVDYVKVYEIVKAEMEIRSKLIEHVAKRIHMALLKKYPQIQKAEVKVTKLNPPINGNVESTSVLVSE